MDARRSIYAAKVSEIFNDLQKLDSFSFVFSSSCRPSLLLADFALCESRTMVWLGSGPKSVLEFCNLDLPTFGAE